MSQVSVEQAIQMGLEHHRAGRLAEAEAIYRQVLAQRPGEAEALHLLGAVAGQSGHVEAAIELIGKAIELRPNMAAYHSNLSRFLMDARRPVEAEAACRRALALYPAFVDAWYNLGNALKMMSRYSEAAAAYREALRHKPEMAEAWTNLGNVLKDVGRMEEAVGCYRKTLEYEPWASADHSNLLLALVHLPGMTGERMLAEARGWERMHAAKLAAAPPALARREVSGRRVRVGYVSPDFRDHSVAYFIEGVLAGHDRERFEVFCYADFHFPADEVTGRLRGYGVTWRETTRMSDAEVAELVRGDGIDVLVDLAGHTANNRLLVFARRAAPVQVTWMGYPGTTGMSAMDYRITDAIADPAGEADALHSEKLYRLRGCFLCYRAPADAPAVAAAAPASRGQVAFGCFNAMAKINAELVGWWAEILRRVSGSRMIVKNAGMADAGARAWLAGELEKRGVSLERVEMLPRVPGVREHLEVYSRIDIALDTYPYHGTTTTCEALWMGVPVVTLAGKMHASRVGASLLTAVGLAEMVADTREGYVDIAVRTAGDIERLAWVRGGLREKMRQSPLMNAAQFVADLERAYFQMLGVEA